MGMRSDRNIDWHAADKITKRTRQTYLAQGSWQIFRPPKSTRLGKSMGIRSA